MVVTSREGSFLRASIIHETKPKLSPLVQGGLEIPIKVTVRWAAVEKLSVLAAKVKEVEYPITGDYIDDSKNILAELGVEKEEEEEDEEEVGLQLEKENNDYEVQMVE